MKPVLPAILIGLIFWPFSLYLANTVPDFLHYLLPTIMILLSLVLYKKRLEYFPAPLLLIPILEPKLTLLPIIFNFINYVVTRTKKNLLLLTLAIILLAINWNKFIGQTVFIKDYEAQQRVLRDTKLYNSIFVARLFHNKGRIALDKFTYNFFAITDPNNYLFGFHPRQIPGNQNLVKFPFLALIFFTYGIYYIKKNSERSFILILFISSVLSLSALTNFDRNDFILYIPLAQIFIHGNLQIRQKSKYATVVYLIFILFSVVDLLRISVAK